MVVISKSQRTNLPPGGSALPAPSGTRLNVAGQAGRDIAAVGETIHSIGLKAQRANDNAEFKTETITAEATLNTELARIKQEVQDPDEYEIQARKAIDGLSGKVGFRNKSRFNNMLQQLKANAGIAITKEKFGKVADKSKAAHTLLKDSVIQGLATGRYSQAEANAIVGKSTDELTANGIFDQENKVAQDRGFAGRVAEVAFESRFPDDPTGAINELNQNKNISVEVKQNLIDKEVRKFNLVDKQKKEAKRLDRTARVKDFKVGIRKGEVTEDDLIQDAILHPDNPMSVEEFGSLLNGVNKVIEVGGVGDPDKFNEMKRNIRRDAKMFSINDIYAFEDAHDLNAPQSEQLEALWEKRITGANDPNDITTFREFDDGMRFIDLFAPGAFDTGSELGIKKLRGEQAEGFAEGRARELFKTNKDVESVMATVRLDTMKHMQEYDKLVKEFIEQTPDIDTASIFQIESEVIPQLKAQKRTIQFGKELEGKILPTQTEPSEGTIRTDAALDEIEAVFDRAEAENRELTETEIETINELQEIPVGNNTGT